MSECFERRSLFCYVERHALTRAGFRIDVIKYSHDRRTS